MCLWIIYFQFLFFSATHYIPRPATISQENLFIEQWRDSLGTQSKLKFYRQVKNGFGEEAYLQLSNSSYRSHIAKLRPSSHDLMIEKGSYGQSTLDLFRKICRFCCSNNDNTMIDFKFPPCHEVPILESEEQWARANRVPCLSLFNGSSIRQPKTPTLAQRVRSDHVLHTDKIIWVVPPSLLQT